MQKIIITLTTAASMALYLILQFYAGSTCVAADYTTPTIVMFFLKMKIHGINKNLFIDLTLSLILLAVFIFQIEKL
jgi:hypothetical protein